MKSLILAAGYATRLWPLTLNQPKSLLPVKNKAIIDYIVDKIKKIDDLDDIYIVSNATFVKNFEDWKNSHKISKRISVVDNGIDNVNQRRGSIGDILFGIENKNIKDDLLIIAGDNLFNFDLTDFMKFCLSHKTSVTLGLFDVADRQAARQYGIAAIDSNSIITDFVEKPKDPPSTLAAMCLYFIPAAKLNLLTEYKNQGFALDFAGNFIEWLSKIEPVYGYAFKGMWLDIGDEKSLKFAQLNYKE
ncbi:MAG: nucleotidyltransferase family protein [Candidatus Omnitrophica bacterium]|nr:nucleotidyltransferase family protein [Candidatus Omnitrophota bacterium]